LRTDHQALVARAVEDGDGKDPLFAGGALSEATPLGAESLSAEQQADRLAFVEVFRSQGTTQPDHAKVLGEPNARPD